MGQEILYCFKCQSRIVGADFGKGAAYEVGNKVCCSKCAAELLNTLPPQEREQLLAQMFKATQERKSGSTNAALPALTAPMTSSSTRMRTPAVPGGGDGSSSSTSVILAVVGVVVLLVLALVLLNSGGKPAAPPPPPDRSVKTYHPELPAPAVEPDEVRRAREFARANPKDIEGQIVSWRAAVLALDRAPEGEVAQKTLERLLALQKDAVKTALVSLDLQTKPYLANEEFGQAADILRAARSKFGAPEWTQAVDRKIDEARSSAAALLPPLKVKAADARKRGAGDEIKALQERVRKWGFSDLSGELETVLSDAPPPSKPAPTPAPAPVPAPAASKELDAYLPRWEAAFGRAAAGDAAGAAQDLSAAVQALTEAALKAEGAEDLEALRRAAAAVQEIRVAVGKTPKGQKVAFERWNDSGAIERVEGTAMGAEPGRLLLRTDAGLVPLETGELTLGTIADLYAARPSKKPGDEKTAALLALLGGDADRGSKLKVEVPERWRKFAGKAAAAVVSGREADARRLYAEAEEAAGDPARVATALGNYKTLLGEFGATAFVARNRAMLSGRPNLGKEYLFFADTMRASGSFGLAKAGRQDSAWLSDRDSDAGTAPQNFVELSFTALPDLDYRLWVYAAGCCLETFSFGVQGTEMVLPSNRAASAEPGGSAVIPIRPPLSLKKMHEMHTGPKSPTRWEWIPVPLPKYATPGVKVIRLQTDQKGFAVAYASVSALTSNSPRESELRDLEKARKGRPISVKEIPGLVAHYPLDEGNGGTSAEASGRLPAAVISGGTTWTTGRIGAGLRFDGGDTWAELPNAPALKGLTTGSYTISAWFLPESVPPSTVGEANDHCYGIVERNGMHHGLHYSNPGAFVFSHWLGEDIASRQLVWTNSKPYPPGVFYHLVGGVDRSAGKAFLYVNGKLEQASKFDSSKRPWDFGDNLWRLGIGEPHRSDWRWCAKGVVDDVRFYNRALAGNEIDAIYRAASPAPSPKAAPADARPWKPIFDGKTAGCINSTCLNAWQAKDGAIANVPGVDNAGQTRDETGDGDLRIRFESRGNSSLWFTVRQSGANGYSVDLRQLGDLMNLKEHELVFIMRGTMVTATVDDKPVRVDTRAASARGVMQFNCSTDGSLRIRAIDFRDPK
jgi:hypothetical protein